MATTSSVNSGSKIPFYRDERVLRWIAQIVSAILIIGFLIWAGLNFVEAARARGMNLGYQFLELPAGFPISDPGIEYDPSMSFGRAFLVGLANTLRVSVVGILIATILGTVIALARISNNWLMSKLALAFIEFHRNIPLLVLLFLWYFSAFQRFPRVEEAIELPGPVYLTQRGVYLTWMRLNDTGSIFMVFCLVAVGLSIALYSILRRKRARTGQEACHVRISLAGLVVLPLIGWFVSGGDPVHFDVPSLVGKNYQGGMRIVPEFGALLVGLTTYTAAFIAEVVRAGIQAVDRGQLEAARAQGLNNVQVLSLVVMPQALRVMIPPMISQYLNLTKNSSLALLIGYQDLFSVGKIIINQAGRAVPVFILIMLSYLSLSIITSFVLNIYNKRIQLVER